MRHTKTIAKETGMYEYTIREQALWQVLACVYESHPDQALALSKIEDLIAGLRVDCEVKHSASTSALKEEIKAVRASLA